MAWKSDSGYYASSTTPYVRPTEVQLVRDRPSPSKRAAFCVQCAAPLKPDYGCCPQCATEVATVANESLPTHHCSGCHRKLDPAFKVCPYCRLPISGRPEPAILCLCGTGIDRGHRHCGSCGKPRQT